MTHTYVVMDVSQQTYDEVRANLRAAGYEHAIGQAGDLDMHGLALALNPAIEPRELVTIDGKTMAPEHLDRGPGFIKPDDAEHVYFYEQDYYVLSNFSAFNLRWRGLVFPTSEHAYQWEKFHDPSLQKMILNAPSAHEAFKLAERNKPFRKGEWDEIKLGVMKDILEAKVQQHEYVMRKLLATGDRVLIEDSWRDDYWGWGPNRDGKNMLGELWMELRSELRAGDSQ
jgi:ribA/ribD-fused uncharacterized protein